MSGKDRRLTALIAYDAFLQVAHLCAMLWSLHLYRQQGEITFLAAPPSGGWSGQSESFLLALGAVDFLNALLTLFFAFGYLARRHWWPRTGLVALTISITSALVYGLATGMSGAWLEHPLDYILLVALFLPLIPLFFMLLNRRAPDLV